MSFLIKNLTANPVEIDDLGLTVAVGTNLDLVQETANSVAISTDLLGFISAGSLRVISPLDGITELSQSDSLKIVQLANDPHYGIKAGKTIQLDDFSTNTPNNGEVPQWDSVNGEYVPSILPSLPQTHFYSHNNLTTQTFGAGLITILFPSIVRADLNYTYNNGATTILSAGWYEITYQISSANGTNRRSTSEVGIAINSLNVFIPGSLSYGYHRNSSQGYDTVVGSILINLNANDIVRIRTRRVAGNGIMETIVNGCRINISSIGAS